MPRPTPDGHDTADRILDVAERFVQTRGFNGFSFGDVAKELGITTAALHYHFPGKAALGTALVERYTIRFNDALGSVDALGVDARRRLASYADIYLGVLRAGRMCLCGMLAAEYQTLPAEVQEAVMAFFDANEQWLAGVLVDGRTDGTLQFEGTAEGAATTYVSALEGAMLVARLYGDAARFESAAAQLLAGLEGRASS